MQRLMRQMGLEAIYRKPNLSRAQAGQRVYPYLLRDLPVTRPNQVWATDITYVPVRRPHSSLGDATPMETYRATLPAAVNQ